VKIPTTMTLSSWKESISLFKIDYGGRINVMKESWRTPHFRLWLAIIGSTTLVLGAAYAMTQQSTRLAANDLPISTAQTIKKQLTNETEPSDFIPTQKVDLKTDNSVFTIITDGDHHVLISSAELNGKVSLPPAGVFDFAKAHGSDDITWQPQKGVRLATHIETYSAPSTVHSPGFIITGQSLKPMEDRINTYGLIALVAWIAVLIWASATILWKPQYSLAPAKKK
jgi:hypothetical protein